MSARKPVDPREIFIRSTIPDPEIASRYVHREIGGHRDFEVFAHAHASRQNVLLYGPTGSAKTTAFEAYAAEKQIPFVQISSHAGAEPGEYFGQLAPTEDGGVTWVDGRVTVACDLVESGVFAEAVILVNEINFLPRDFASILFSVFRERRFNLQGERLRVVDVPPGVLLAADMNRGYRGTAELNEALWGRFHHKVRWDYDLGVEEQLLQSESLLEMAQRLRHAGETLGEIDTPVSTHMLMVFEAHAQALSIDYAISNFVAEFSDDERPAVQTIVLGNLYRDRIVADLGAKSVTVPSAVWTREALDALPDAEVRAIAVEALDFTAEDPIDTWSADELREAIADLGVDVAESVTPADQAIAQELI